MDRSTLRLPDPVFLSPHGERRRSVRQKLQTPIYVSFNSTSAMAVDLNELLNLHEHGFAVQTAVPTGSERNGLEVNRTVELRLDLPETKKIVHGSGEVIWTDEKGRAGIRFSALSDDARLMLKEWLFTNLLIAATHHPASAQPLGRPANESRTSNSPNGGRAFSPAPAQINDSFPPSAEEPAAPASPGDDDSTAPIPMLVSIPIMVPEPESVPEDRAAAGPDQAELLSVLDEVGQPDRQAAERPAEDRQAEDQQVNGHQIADRELKVSRDDQENALQLITARAMQLTGATGAALALLTDGRMICRASCGDPAPPLGSEVDVKSGLSGECIRSGLVVSCEDPDRDARVDPDVCRALGIGSFMAAPIFADFRVAGLLEIFSSHRRSFTAVHGSILERLVESISEIEKNKVEKMEDGHPHASGPATTIEDERSGPSAPAATMEDEWPGSSNTESATNPADAPIVNESNVPEETVSNEDEATAFEPRRQPHLVHLALLVLVLGTVAMVMGYLLAPTIQRHWGAQAAPSSNPSSAQASPNISPVSAASLQNAADRQAHPISPEDLRKRADQGDADAQWQLGILYHDGGVVAKDDTQAVQWFQRAAEQGYVRAQSTLGAYYWAGRGVPQDFSKAYFWSQLALAQGDEISKSRLEGLAAQMTPSQVAKARQEAELWLRSHTQRAK